MSTPARPHDAPPARTGPLVGAVVLLLIPLLALAAVPTYARTEPQLGGFPFFVWYQLMWVFLTACCTAAAHALVKRARPSRAPADAAGERP